MDLADIRLAVQDHGYGTDTTDQQTRFINEAYREIHRARRWPFLEAIDTSSNTAAGTPSYAIPMSNWRNLDAVRLSWPADLTQNLMIDYMEPQDLFDRQQNDPTVATPQYWTMYAQQLWFYPIPDQAYQIKIFYIIEPPDLADDADVPLVPVAYHDLLVTGALFRSAARQRDFINMELWQAKWGSDLRDLEEEYLIKQRQTSSQVKKSGYWSTYIDYPLSSTGF